MSPNNPGCYECPRGGEQKLHVWARVALGKIVAVKCQKCNLIVLGDYAQEIMEDHWK